MKASLLAFAFVLIASLHAQELAPELAPLVAKHKADLAALDAQEATAMARVQQPYFAALDSSEKSATSAGKLEEVAAITKEREALKSGLMAPAFPSDLPKALQSARKSYLDGMARAAADLAPRQRTADADYLRGLAALQAKAADNPELAKQVAEEKQKLLANAAGIPAKVGGNSQPQGRNVVVNGTFDLADAEARPRGWTFYGPGAEGLFKVVREGPNSVLHLAISGAPISVGATQKASVPSNAKTMTLRGRVRGQATDHRPNDANWGANINARFTDENGKEVGGDLLIGRPDAGWKILAKTMSVPSSAKEAHFACIGWWVSGTFDFDDIEVEFR